MQSLSGRVPRESEGGRRAVAALNFGARPACAWLVSSLRHLLWIKEWVGARSTLEASSWLRPAERAVVGSAPALGTSGTKLEQLLERDQAGLGQGQSRPGQLVFTSRSCLTHEGAKCLCRS